MKHVRHQVSPPPGEHFTRLRHVTCAQPTNHRPRTCRRARHQSAADDNNGRATGDRCRPISCCIVTTTPRRTVTTALSTLRYRHWNNNRGLYRPASCTARALTITQPLLHTDNYHSRCVSSGTNHTHQSLSTQIYWTVSETDLCIVFTQ